MRRRRGYRVNGFTMDDLALGDLVGDRSDEPRLDVDYAVDLLADAQDFQAVQTILTMVRRRDRKLVIKRAHAIRGHKDHQARNNRFRDERLPFNPNGAA